MARSSLEVEPGETDRGYNESNDKFKTLPLRAMHPRDSMQVTQILLVEDDDIDAMAFDRHLGNANFKYEIHRAIDGSVALDMLRGSGGADLIPKPHMIVLDLNMPRMSGIEFLQELRADDDFQNCVVFIFTTSNAEKDRIPCFEHNVAAYLLKSKAGRRFEKLIALLESYVAIAEFPPDHADAE